MSFYKNNLIKEYPEHRVCVIDFLPSVEQAVNDTYTFFLNMNVPSSFFLKNKKDLLNVFYHYLLDNLCKTYQDCHSSYNKVIITYELDSNSKIPLLFKQKIKSALKACPVHWCQVSSLQSPDVGLIASATTEKQRIQYSKILKFTKNKKLTAITDKIKKNRIYSNISVDFSALEK